MACTRILVGSDKNKRRTIGRDAAQSTVGGTVEKVVTRQAIRLGLWTNRVQTKHVFQTKPHYQFFIGHIYMFPASLQDRILQKWDVQHHSCNFRGTFLQGPTGDQQCWLNIQNLQDSVLWRSSKHIKCVDCSQRWCAMYMKNEGPRWMRVHDEWVSTMNGSPRWMGLHDEWGSTMNETRWKIENQSLLTLRAVCTKMPYNTW